MRKTKRIRFLSFFLIAVMLLTSLSGCDRKTEPEKDTPQSMEQTYTGDDLTGYKVGVMEDTLAYDVASQMIPEIEISTRPTAESLAADLEMGKIQAYVLDEPLARVVLSKYPNQQVYCSLTNDDYSFVFQKDSGKGSMLQSQMNEFLHKIKSDGSLTSIDRKWFGQEIRSDSLDFSNLTGINGTLKFAVYSNIGAPFVYRSESGDFIGYEIELMTLFCEEYGYNFEIFDVPFSDLINGVSTGKYDMAASCITRTSERENFLAFSDADYRGGFVAVIRNDDVLANGADSPYASGQSEIYQRYFGKNIGYEIGTNHEKLIKTYIKNANPYKYASTAELSNALENGIIDAYVVDKLIAEKNIENNPDQYIDLSIGSTDYAFAFPKVGSRSIQLQKQMNEFLNKYRENGLLESIRKKWDEAEKDAVLEVPKLSGENGTVVLGVATDIQSPLLYTVNGSEYAGLEMQLIYEFCQEYGYDIVINNYNFSGLMSAIQAGKCDIGASSISIEESRKEYMYFSDSHYETSISLVARESDKENTIDMSGKSIGVETGSIFDSIALEHFPECKIEYYNHSSDLPAALEAGKIQGYIIDKPIGQLIMNEYKEQYFAAELVSTNCAYFFPKGTEKTAKILSQMNDFLKTNRSNGTLSEIEKIWFGTDDSQKFVDYKSLPDINGTLTMAVSSEVGQPFAYLVNGALAGYDIDVAARFCKEYGYALEVEDTNIAGMLAAVSGGRCDFGGSSVMITEERLKSMDFSEPNYFGAVCLMLRKESNPSLYEISDPAVFQNLSGCRVGVITGSIHDEMAMATIPDAEIYHFNTGDELSQALDSGRIDAYMTDQPIARISMKNYPDQNVFGVVSHDSYAYIFPQSGKNSDLVRVQLNGFLSNLRKSGELDEIDRKWFGEDPENQDIDFSGLTGENGTLKMAVSTDVGAPFCFLKGGKYVGYDIEIAVRFCREYGYSLQFENFSLAGMLSAVTSGKCSFGAGCISITEERMKSINFSDPNYNGGVVVVTKGNTFVPGIQEKNIFDPLIENFKKTFLVENRWQLFLSGILLTLEIVVLSVLFGSALGFAVFFAYRKKSRLFNRLVHICQNILGKTPVVVILMVLYYIIFNDAALNGMWVSVFGFTLIFASSVISLLKVAVNAIDPGQMEAALALGFSDSASFIHLILPQALRHFLPGYQDEIVNLIKSTAIVGYIAVQDLTKTSDIIRSRTYEPFFPLIASAIFYFLISTLLIWIVKSITLSTDPKKRPEKEILRGIVKK